MKNPSTARARLLFPKTPTAAESTSPTFSRVVVAHRHCYLSYRTPTLLSCCREGSLQNSSINLNRHIIVYAGCKPLFVILSL
eukprot:2194872-Pleurochrysis_carterae.AAC.1